MEELNEELYKLMVPYSNINYYFGIDLLLPPRHLKKPKSSKVGWKIYELVSVVYLLVATMSMLGGAYKGFVSSNMLFAVFMLFVASLQIIQPVVKLYIGISQRRFKKFLSKVNELLINNKSNPILQDGDLMFQKVYSRHFRLQKTFTYIYLFVVEGGTFVFLLEGWISSPAEDRSIHILGWSPDVVEVSLGWHLLFFSYGTCQFFMSNGKTVALDGLFWSLTTILRCQLLFMKRMLGVLLKEDLKDDVELKKRLDWWIKQHQTTLECCCELRELLSPSITFEYLLCLSLLVFCIFCVPQAYFLGISQKSAVIGGEVTHLIMMYNFCDVSDFWEEYSQTMAESAYSPRHIFGSTWLLSHIKIIFVNTTRPVRLAIFGGFPVSRKLLLFIIQGIYTYYTALLQISSVRRISATKET